MPDIAKDQLALDGARQFAGREHGLFIDGEWREPRSGSSFETFNPGDGSRIGRAAAGGEADVDLAVRAARAALDGPWATMKPSERARLLWRLADAIEAHADEFALLETLNNGKPLRDARMFDVPHAVEVLRYNAGWPTKLNGESVNLSGPGTWHAYTVREPVGVVAAIVPWNAPLAMAVAKTAPALAAGCTIILKPAEQTPLTALRLAHLMAEVGFPKGVFNLVTGLGEAAGAALVAHPGVDKVTFTGSTEVGRLIVKGATVNMKRVTLELGGKTPVIVMPDADINRAIEGAARSIFTNAGQICNAGSRLFAHESVFDALVEGVADFAGKLRVGPGLDPDTQMGPVVSAEQKARVLSYIEAGLRDGAKISGQGSAASGPGYFVPPTVLTGTNPQMSVVREEIFGPVLCAMSFSDRDLDAIAAQANDTDYGLGAIVWTQNLSAAHKLARKIKAGTVRVNGGGLDPALPFGGFKQSGWGRENGREGVEAYTEVKSIAIAL
ncbi:aldehyde dehydrogenase family protein [Niveispirillum sp.]|uniref:aldehyde dehydrogenase family protein n=1 Tax=Niveispirillum sp. TaxID=1917217 RepID=UPI001B684B1B|nr:aldehyde dehydrogenase family protein [Niveispirillum sp.]MBP7340290.1 aldehyde dehydrogenase family protein [Niveispirillum sp.]